MLQYGEINRVEGDIPVAATAAAVVIGSDDSKLGEIVGVGICGGRFGLEQDDWNVIVVCCGHGG